MLSEITACLPLADAFSCRPPPVQPSVRRRVANTVSASSPPCRATRAIDAIFTLPEAPVNRRIECTVPRPHGASLCTNLAASRLARGGYPPLSLSRLQLYNPRSDSHPTRAILPTPRHTAPDVRRDLSHVCPFVGARYRGGLCHRTVLCWYQQCRDGPGQPRPCTRLLDRGQSTRPSRSFLFLTPSGPALFLPLPQYNRSIYPDTEAFCRAFRSQCVNYAGGINQHHQLDCVFERPDGSHPQPGPKIRAFCGGIEKKPDGSWDTKRTPVQDNVSNMGLDATLAMEIRVLILIGIRRVSTDSRGHRRLLFRQGVDQTEAVLVCQMCRLRQVKPGVGLHQAQVRRGPALRCPVVGWLLFRSLALCTSIFTRTKPLPLALRNSLRLIQYRPFALVGACRVLAPIAATPDSGVLISRR